MNETVMLSLLLALMMTKKKPRKFGQMTLNLGGQALEYLKSDPKGILRSACRVEWMNKNHAVDRGHLEGVGSTLFDAAADRNRA